MMTDKIKKSWQALRACADVTLEECGGLKIKRNQCIAVPETIYRILRVKYAELRPADPLVKEGTKEQVALSGGVHEIYEEKKAKPAEPPKEEAKPAEPVIVHKPSDKNGKSGKK